MKTRRFKILTLPIENSGRVFFCLEGWLLGFGTMLCPSLVRRRILIPLCPPLKKGDCKNYKEESIAQEIKKHLGDGCQDR
jgi:hypothetical protein